MRAARLVLPLAAALAVSCAAFSAKPVKVVVLSLFETGEDTGDAPGEFQFWVERNEVERLEAPLGHRDYYLRSDGILYACLGGGISNAAASTMALALDDRFDFSKAYWIVAGIAGVDPLDASLGSVAWAKWVVDADLAKEIDAREMPESWPYGLFALGSKAPDTLGEGWQVDTVRFRLNEALVKWAYEATREVELLDHEAIRAFRQSFEGYPNATRPPFVLVGDSLASSTYWHGNILNEWANNWVKLHTGSEGEFVMTNMEDSGLATALRRASKAGLADFDRLLVLRSGSNYTMPPPGEDVSWSLLAEYPAQGLPALENAYRVGSVVAERLVEGWETYVDAPPEP